MPTTIQEEILRVKELMKITLIKELTIKIQKVRKNPFHQIMLQIYFFYILCYLLYIQINKNIFYS